MIHGQQHTVPVQVLVDSGADDNFIDGELIEKYNIPTQTLSALKQVLVVDGKLIKGITKKTEPLELILYSNHHKFVELYVITSPMSSVILGTTPTLIGLQPPSITGVYSVTLTVFAQLS